MSTNNLHYGFYEHHTADCDIDLRPPTHFSHGTPYRTYWCKTHGQWCYEQPVKTVWTFGDGETVERVPKTL